MRKCMRKYMYMVESQQVLPSDVGTYTQITMLAIDIDSLKLICRYMYVRISYNTRPDWFTLLNALDKEFKKTNKINSHYVSASQTAPGVARLRRCAHLVLVSLCWQ